MLDSTATSISSKQFKISFKKFFYPALLFMVVVLVLIKFSELREIGRLFSHAKWYWLALAFISQAVNFTLQGKVYQAIFKILKFSYFSFSKLIKAAITVIFLNYTIPSLGFAGNIYFLKTLRQHGLKEGKGLLSIILEFICYYLAFIIVLIISFLYLFFKLHRIGVAQQAAVVGFFVLLGLIAFITYFWLGNRQRAKKRVLWFAQKFNQIEEGEDPEERVDNLLKDFYKDVEWMIKNKRKIALPTTVQLVKFFSDALTIYLIFLAFGFIPPLGLPLVAFAFGRLFGLVSFIPGGVGAFEGSMVLIFNSLGIQLELSLAVMLIYRFFSFWLYFPLGLVFYKQLDGRKATIN